MNGKLIKVLREWSRMNTNAQKVHRENGEAEGEAYHYARAEAYADLANKLEEHGFEEVCKYTFEPPENNPLY